MPLFPGTGALSETGVGNICNAPLRAGDDRENFEDAFLSRILPALNNFAPDILFISAGFDAHRDDPLAQIELTEPDFAWVTEKLVDVAEKHSGGRVVSTLEGGYDLNALAGSAAAHVEVLMQASS
jgi:acetoin utilization deacetylase AcuC-like enzyme